MNTITHLITTLILTFAIAVPVVAQQAAITGRVIDEQNNPLDLATVNLLNAKDSTLMKTVFPDGEGNFSFLDIQQGTYRVTAVLVGYEDTVSEELEIKSNTTTSIGTLMLTGANTVLEEGAVTAPQRPLVERRPDMLVVN